MRDPNALYDPTLNEADPDQEVAAKAVFEFVQELRKAALSDDKLEIMEIFQVAVANAPGAVAKVIDMVKGGDPIASDVEMLAHIISRQLGAYDASVGSNQPT